MKIKNFISELTEDLSIFNIAGDIELTLAVDIFGNVVDYSDTYIRLKINKEGKTVRQK